MGVLLIQVEGAGGGGGLVSLFVDVDDEGGEIAEEPLKDCELDMGNGEGVDQQLVDFVVLQAVDEVEELLVGEIQEQLVVAGHLRPGLGAAQGQPHDSVVQRNHQLALLAGLQQPRHFCLHHLSVHPRDKASEPRLLQPALA